MWAVLLLLLMFSSPAGADSSAGEPVFLSANELGYDRKQAVVVALGQVKIIQGDIILLADRLTYDQTRNEVTANGNVSLRQPNGDVLFADTVRLKDNLEAGVIQNFRARFADNSLFAAREARKINADITEMDKAVYSPCKLCEGNDPLWQVKADEVTIDEKEQTVSYRNAWMEFWGVPIAYTPYFSHATPGADAKSGLLAPEAGVDSKLGTVLKLPVFTSIASNADATLTPVYLGKEAPMLFGEYRHLFDNGYMQWRGSITNPQSRNEFGDLTDGRDLRGHIKAFGDFTLSDHWNWGFDVNRTTDDTYLRRYDISNEDTLTSRAFVQHIDGRRYASVQGLAFQGLTAQDDSDTTPLITPMADFSWEGAPNFWNSRASVNASSMVLGRDIGAQSRRLSVETGWTVPLVTRGGHVFESKASLRTDAYSVENVVRDPTRPDYDGTVARIIPQLELGWRYPLINEYAENRSLLLEPVAQFIVSPTGSNSSKIPNEDSLTPEFNDANLFMANRFAGYDRVETGPRFNFGVQGLWQFADNTNLDFLFGQHFRTDEENPFPFSNDLTEKLSDYVGRLALNWDTTFTTAYRFRLDRNDLSPKRTEINTLLNLSPFWLQVDYLDLNSDPFLDDRQEVVASGSVAVTDYWTLFAGTRRDLKQNQQTVANAGFRYRDECFNLYGNFSRSLIRDRDVEPSSSFVLRVELENLN